MSPAGFRAASIMDFGLKEEVITVYIARSQTPLTQVGRFVDVIKTMTLLDRFWSWQAMPVKT